MSYTAYIPWRITLSQLIGCVKTGGCELESYQSGAVFRLDWVEVTGENKNIIFKTFYISKVFTICYQIHIFGLAQNKSTLFQTKLY